MSIIVTSELERTIHKVLAHCEATNNRRHVEMAKSIMAVLHRDNWLKEDVTDEDLFKAEQIIRMILREPPNFKDTYEQDLARKVRKMSHVLVDKGHVKSLGQIHTAPSVLPKHLKK